MGEDGSEGGRARVVAMVTAPAGQRAMTRGLGQWLARAAPARARGDVSVALVSDAAMRRLNRSYRGIDRPTDVLSFPASTDASVNAGRRSYVAPTFRLRAKRFGETRRSSGSDHSGAEAVRSALNAARKAGAAYESRFLGDIAIAIGVAKRQARHHGHSLATELRVLALHGLLHLLGYDHDADAGEMVRFEERLRRRLGLPTGLIARTTTRMVQR